MDRVPSVERVESQPVHNTLVRRLTIRAIWRLAMKRPTRYLFERSQSCVFFGKFCIKTKWHNRLAEARSMLFVAEKTSIPVPKVYCSFMHNDCTYLVTERIKGKPLYQVWSKLSDKAKDAIFAQLRDFVEQLRALKAKGVSDVHGGPIFDVRLPKQDHWGPFDTVEDFHLALRNGWTRETLDSMKFHENFVADGSVEEWYKLVDFQDHGPSIFTHGDLSGFNIIINNDRVAAIIDWETAGYLPYYWEYTNAKTASPPNWWWIEYAERYLEPFPAELEIELIRRKHFGDY